VPGPGPGRGQRGPGQRQLGGDRVRACGLGEDGELPEQLAGPVQLEAQGAAGGQRQDASVLYYLRNRYYDPATGQFLTTDPLLDLTQAPYNYISDDPLNGTDLTGLCGFWCNVGIGALVRCRGNSLHHRRALRHRIRRRPRAGRRWHPCSRRQRRRPPQRRHTRRRNRRRRLCFGFWTPCQRRYLPIRGLATEPAKPKRPVEERTHDD